MPPTATLVGQEATPGPFLLTATQIIRRATLTATARGTSGPLPTITPSPMGQALTTTPAAPPDAVLSAQAGDEADENGDPLMLTFVAFGTLLLILVVFGYVVVNASNMPEGRNR